MMAMLHVKSLYVGNQTGTGSFVTVYATPAGYRAVVRNIVITRDAATSGYCYVAIGGVKIWNPTAPAFGRVEWNTWVALDPAAEIRFLGETGKVFGVTISGSEYVV